MQWNTLILCVQVEYHLLDALVADSPMTFLRVPNQDTYMQYDILFSFFGGVRNVQKLRNISNMSSSLE